MKRYLLLLLAAIWGCAEGPSAPDLPIEASTEEREQDPLKAGRELIDEREEPGNLDRAIRLLEYHSTQKPQSAAIHILAAEAYSRALEDLEDRKSRERDRLRRLLAKGLPHGQEADRIEPTNGA